MLQLTSLQLSKVVTSLKTVSEKQVGNTDKRRFSRIGVETRIPVGAVAGVKLQRLYSALTRDISYGGIGIMQSPHAERGNLLVVHLPVGDKDSIAILCTVMYGRLAADGMFCLGAQFVQEVDKDFIAQLAQVEQQEAQRIQQSIMG